MINKPLILINFKQSTGEKALQLVQQLNEASFSLNSTYEIAIVVRPEDTYGISRETCLPIFIHDMFLESPLYELLNKEYIVKCRIQGVLINHPQKRVSDEVLRANCQYAKDLNLKMIIGSTSIKEALIMHNTYFPDYIAIENVDLIGKDISIIHACPEMIVEAISKISNKLLFGSGVKSTQDIVYILENGGAGVLVASIIISAENPSKALTQLLAV